jgi:adenylosuccinate lyase
MELNELTALSPLDGRYRGQLGALPALASEFGLLRARVHVEIEWFLFLANLTPITELPPVDPAIAKRLRRVATDFDVDQARRIKDLERTTNHDVKAVEYYVKAQIRELTPLANQVEFVHFACTSEDINNLAHGAILAAMRAQVLLPAMDEIDVRLTGLADAFADAAMLARTHGQVASPTTMGKELANFAFRLRRQRQQFNSVAILGKMNGAVGNYNAHRSAYPSLDWPKIGADFVASLGLTANPYTTQIEPHDYMAEYCHALTRFNHVLLDFDRDIWSYIAIDYFRQRKVAGETGSSTMPHKVNPIDFENSEGNLGLANALLAHLADKLMVSRWQRDLSDSTVLRNLGVAGGHCLLAYRSALKGIDKLELNRGALDADLDRGWEVLAEAIQTVMRKHGLDQPYERLKSATRGQRFDAAGYRAILAALDLPLAARRELEQLTPADYVGFATELAHAAGQNVRP